VRWHATDGSARSRAFTHTSANRNRHPDTRNEFSDGDDSLSVRGQGQAGRGIADGVWMAH